MRLDYFRGRSVGFVAVLGLMAAGRGAAAQQSSAPAPPLVLTGVTVIDVEHGARIYNRNVVIVGNRIQALGSRRKVTAPAGARIVDGRGKYLIPGLWDMHAHPAHVGFSTDDVWGYAEARAAYRQFVANGVTGLRDAGSPIPLDTFRVWKREIAAGTRIGPRMIVSGPSLNSGGQQCTTTNHSAAECKPSRDIAHYVYIFGPEDAPRLVDSIKAAGADMIKLHNLSEEHYFALVSAARRAGIPFGGHAPRDGGLVLADSGGMIVDHDFPGPDGVCEGRSEQTNLVKCKAAGAHLRRQHTWIAVTGAGASAGPGDSAYRAFTERAFRSGGPLFPDSTWKPLPPGEQQPPSTSADWAKAYGTDSTGQPRGCASTLLQYQADLPVLLGPDFFPGHGVQMELIGMQACGVPALWVLQTATLNPALALHATDSLGTVEVGKVADLVLLDGDPLADIANITRIAGVVANGHYFDRSALDRMLEEAVPDWRTVERAVGRP